MATLVTVTVPATVALALASLVACGDRAPSVGEWQQATGHRWRALDVQGGALSSAGARAGFTALSASHTGITHRNDVADEHAMANRNLLIGAGAAVADIDGDGYPDLFLASVEKPAALYRNAGGLRFEEITATSGLKLDSLATTGATFADVDNDGDADLLVGTHGGPVTLWLNDGKGHFTDGTAASGLIGGYAATTMTLADVDRDGDLDLYVATYKVRNALDAYPPQARAFDQVVTKTATSYAVKPEWVKEYRIEDRPDLGGIVRSQRADPDLFFINDGSGHFTHTPISGARFRDESGVPLAAEPDFFTLAARFYDVNGDGAPDLYVCNDFEDPDQFWINDGTGNFRLVPPWALAATSNTCMSVDFGDVDRDGSVDLFTVDMLSPTLAERQTMIPTHTPLPKTMGLTGARPQWMRNMLHLGRGDGSWAQVADFAGVTATDWTWGSAFLDVDLDGFEDLITVSGHRWDIRDADSFDRLRNSFPRVLWNREQGEFPRLATRNIVLRNNGDATFAAMKDGWGLGAERAISQGIALADFDLDGDLDLIVTRLDAAAQLYRNDAAAPRVAVRLLGSGVGAVVSVSGGALPAQSREVTAGGYYLSGSEPLLTFAAGSDADLRLSVRWPDGGESVIADARASRLYEISEPAAPARAAPAPAATTRGRVAVRIDGARDAARTSPLFEDATARLGGQTHHERAYEDVRRQSLLPGRLSQLGPGLAWADVDGDGRDDLVVGAGKGGSLAVLLNRGDRFTPTRAGATAAGDLTGIVPLPDGRGGVRLAVGQANYEAGTLDSALAIPGVLSVAVASGAASTAVGGDTASVGPLAAGDLNGDGFLDLFVGARVVGGAWPIPAPSRLLLGSADGSFVLDPVNARAMAALGLVSAALFADVTGDAAPDLVVAGEFGPVRLLRNEGGTLVDATASLGLDKLRSRWNGLAAGDFDGDGRLDLVVTSWGRNLPWGASASRPHVLYMGRLGGEALGLVFARADSVTKQEMPLESFARLGVAFPALRSRVPTYGDFATRSVQTLFGADTLGAVRIGATTYDQTILLNRGDRFEARSLPAVAQRAPAFGVNVADFDGDGREDLFLAQNFFPTEIATMRFDAGVGLLLLGDGAGGFRALSVGEAGVVVRGDQRGSAVADFDSDGRTDLAVSQNGGVTTLWRNSRGEPGVRVRLIGPAGNPSAIGAWVSLSGNGWRGPARPVVAGSGYWSSDSPVQVLGWSAKADSVHVRWTSGVETVVPLSERGKEIVIRAP